nr:hypothetical protein [uncultured Rhodoferax sp.]
MAAITISEPFLSALKKAIRKDFPVVKSAHLSEALAYALGFNTHASLLAAHKEGVPQTQILDSTRFSERLTYFGYDKFQGFNFESFAVPRGVATSTESPTAHKVSYKSERSKAWRNLVVFAVNVGIERNLFTLVANDNRWPGALPQRPEETRANGVDNVIYDFELPNGLPVRAYVRDIGWGELSIHVAVNPKGDLLKAFNAGFSAGDAFATSWLERRKGAWLQTSLTEFRCRDPLKPILASMTVTPRGFGDKGGVIM